MIKAYVATVQLLVKANDEADACDGISAILTESADPDFLLDWGYARIGGQYLYPKNQAHYTEGDFLKGESNHD